MTATKGIGWAIILLVLLGVLWTSAGILGDVWNHTGRIQSLEAMVRVRDAAANECVRAKEVIREENLTLANNLGIYKGDNEKLNFQLRERSEIIISLNKAINALTQQEEVR
ncbi:MAG TPA: hypothetical protein DHN29_21590 [Cytophagales bacterium]|nr:hypothetical protein [Cytophagales bacterium]|tara:strand:+ start:4666 stop:4998 length:333 start_codon:yes stop_codon:yes gene_type:complete